MERILWRGDRSGKPLAIDIVSHEFLEAYARLAADGDKKFLPVLRGAARDAREDEFRRQNPPGRVDGILVAVESARDAVSRLVETKSRSLRFGPA